MQNIQHATGGTIDVGPRAYAGTEERAGVVGWALGLLVLVGFALRTAAGRGDLWIDEVWTLSLVSGLHHAHEVFWNISHDNNHFLNSLWLFLLGLDRSPLMYRLPSILMGALSITVAARIGFRISAATGLIAAFVIAVAFPMVNFGSEARGYAGLILAVLIAIDALDEALPLPRTQLSPTERAAFGHARWRLGAAIGFGALSHLTMIMGVAILGLASLLWLARRSPRPSAFEILDQEIRLFGPGAFLLLPAFLSVVAGILVRGGMTIGGTSFAAGRFVTGYGGMIGAILGLPSSVPPWVALAAAAAALGATWWNGLIGPIRGLTAMVGLGLVPALIYAVNPPNTDYPRYFLVCGIILALLLAEAAGRLWSRHRGPWLVSGLLLAFAAGQIALDGRLLAFGRGDVSSLVTAMAGKADPTYAARFSTAFQLALDYHAYRQVLTLRRVPFPFDCADRPHWFLADAPPVSAEAPATLTLGPESCSALFVQYADAPSSALSGRHWTLFERQ